MSSLMLLGTIGWCIYGGYGLAAFPIGMIKGNKNLKEEGLLAGQNLSLIREHKRALEHKSTLRSDLKQDKKDQKELKKLRDKEVCVYECV